MAERSAASSVTVSPSSSVSALFTSSGTSLTFVNVTFTPAGVVFSSPSLTLTSYAGAASPPSCTKRICPSSSCCWVKLVIAVPAPLASSNCPPLTIDTVKISVLAAVSTSVAERSAASSVTVPPSASVSALFTSSGASLTFVNVTLAPAGALLSEPSLTLTSYAGAASPPSCTKRICPSVSCCWVKLVIAVPAPHSPPRTARR